MNTSSEPSETFQRGSGRPFATVDVKKLIFWAAYLVPDLFNCVSRVLHSPLSKKPSDIP